MTGFDGANDQAVPGSFPIAEGDFANNGPAPDVRAGSGERSFAHSDESTAPQHYSSQDFSARSSSTFGQGFSSSTSQQVTFPVQSAGHHSLSTGQQVQAGKMTFKVPDFGDGSSADAEAGDDILSPTQSRS
jgi:hypothetical protein